MKLNRKHIAAVALVGLGTAAVAATGDTAFQTILDTVTSWTEGTLGKLLSITMFVVGMAAGVMRQSLMAAVAGLGGAVALAYGPTIITSVFTALV